MYSSVPFTQNPYLIGMYDLNMQEKPFLAQRSTQIQVPMQNAYVQQPLQPNDVAPRYIHGKDILYFCIFNKMLFSWTSSFLQDASSVPIEYK